MAFWGESMGALSADPKRKFRFKVIFGGSAGDAANEVVWWAKTVDKPKMSVDPTEHKFMGHTFKFPGSVKWEDINLTLVDPVSPDAAQKTLTILSEAGYVFPEDTYATTSTKAMNTMNKGKATAALGVFQIIQLNSDGAAIETWTLHNPFILSIGFGDLSYESDDLSEITLGIMYDWAQLKTEDSYQFKLP